jgi:hypothetical protein
LAVGDTTPLTADTQLVFVDITEDSRCPTQVDCAWEGQVSVLLRTQGSGPAAELTLTLRGQNRPGDASQGDLLGQRVRLLAVTPYPEQPGGIDRQQYRAMIAIGSGGGG